MKQPADPATPPAALTFLSDGGEMGRRIREHDWAATSLGPPHGWPAPLRAALSISLSSSFPTAIYAGPELLLLYNDAWAPVPAERHPWALGRPAAEVWPDIWDVVGPQLESVFRDGASLSSFDQLLMMVRDGRAQETYWNYSFTPLRDEDGRIHGVFNQGHEVTGRVLSDRRRTFLLELTDALRPLRDPKAIIQTAQAALGVQLRASRVGYGEVDETARYFTTDNNWTDGSVPSRHGTHDLSAFGSDIWGGLRDGTPLIVSDVATDPRTCAPESLAAFEAIDTRAAMTVSLLKEGRMCAALYLHTREPREWSDADARLVADVAERTWSAVERARAEAAAQASEARLRALNETLSQQVEARTADRDRMWRLSTDMMLVARFDATITAVSPAWTRLLGWTEDELIGRPFLDLVHPDDVTATVAEVGRLSEGATTFRFENRYQAKDGGYRWISWIAVPENGLIHAVGRDVSREKAAAAELEQAQEALRQSQKLEAMGQLTGGVAHDFNNLLSPIIGGLDLLQRRGVGDERAQRTIGGALAAAERAKVLVQRLLAFARRQPLQPTSVDIAKLVEGMTSLVASTLGPRIKLHLEIDAHLPPARADTNQVEMALLNLAVNARDAMEDGGSFTICAAAETVGSDAGGMLRPGRYVRLAVRDTGIGMDDATAKRAVEPFFSTKGIGKGTGLGLSMVHGLAAQLGGGLGIDSHPGLGTTISLWLPVAGDDDSAGDAPAGEETVHEGAGRALVVDDEELVRASTADMLGDLGYDVTEAGSAAEALRLMESGQHFDVLVTDHLMSGMTGSELAYVVRDRTPSMRLLVVSGYAEVEGIAPDLPRLTKPFRLADLAAALKPD